MSHGNHRNFSEMDRITTGHNMSRGNLWDTVGYRGTQETLPPAVLYAPLVSKQKRTLTDFVFQVMAWVPLHLIKILKLTKIIGVEHNVIK